MLAGANILQSFVRESNMVFGSEPVWSALLVQSWGVRSSTPISLHVVTDSMQIGTVALM